MGRAKMELTESQIRHATAIFDEFRKQKRLVNVAHTTRQVFGNNNGSTQFKLIAALADNLGFLRVLKPGSKDIQKLFDSLYPKKTPAKRIRLWSFVDAIPDWVTRCGK